MSRDEIMMERKIKAEKIDQLYGCRIYSQQKLADALGVSVRELGKLTRDLNYSRTIRKDTSTELWNPVTFYENYPWLDTINMSVLDALLSN